MNAFIACACVLLATGSVHAQAYVYEQPMAPNGGVTRPSQLWIDPTGQNDSDTDALLWEDFELPQTTTITRLRWWGQAAPTHGFRISFFPQDPGTTAVQPHLSSLGGGPIQEAIYTSFDATPAGGGMTRFEVALAAPLTFQGGTRYFVSVVGRTPVPWAEWRWAASSSGPNGTFCWIRGWHMYFHVGESRAVALAAEPGWAVGDAFCAGDGTAAPCPCGNASGAAAGCANSTGLGATLRAFGAAVVGADTVVLAARDCPPTTLGLFFSGPSAVAGTSFGDGLRCVGGSIRRLGVAATAGGVATSAGSLSVLDGLQGGEVRHYQFWYRNPAGPCGGGFNTTNALTIAW